MTTQSVTYRWSGNHSYAVKPEIVAEAVTRIADEQGACKPEMLVEAAKTDTRLFPLFTWDDDKAAHEWRKWEARKVIGSLVRVTYRDDGAQKSSPAFLSVGHSTEDDGGIGGYRPVSVVLANPEYEREAIESALAQLDGVRRRYESLAELSGVWQALDAIERPERKRLRKAA